MTGSGVKVRGTGRLADLVSHAVNVGDQWPDQRGNPEGFVPRKARSPVWEGLIKGGGAEKWFAGRELARLFTEEIGGGEIVSGIHWPCVLLGISCYVM